MARCLRALALCSLIWLPAAHVLANGRMPGANDLVFSTSDASRLVARATFGIVQSADQGATWSWICEQAIDVSGVIADPPLALTADGSLVLLPPTGSALVSSDRGCNWVRAAAPLANTRGADLTIDPSDPARVLVITSTLHGLDAGFGEYENLVVETRDNAHSWQVLATLPSDFEAETIEVAGSDARRIYVSGSDSHDSRLGIIMRSEDAGQTWVKSTLALPAGTGSLWISGIHPSDPDRMWVRVAARGDTLGLLAARLYLSTDKGVTFTQLAATNKGMFGFALSPDGASLAYGGPSDGLFVGPSDGSAFVKRNNLGVRCLRWLDSDLLYVCGSEPNDAFSVGVSADHGVSFRGLYSLVETCPATCAEGTSFADSCQAAWSQTRPFIAATGAMCSVPWSAPAASDDGGAMDASASPAARSDDAAGSGSSVDANVAGPDAASTTPAGDAGSGCDCQIGPGRAEAQEVGLLWSVLGAFALWRRQRARLRSSHRRSR